MKIAILAAEATPYVKTGGLGDVMEALPSALAGMEGNEVILMLPYYNKIKYSSKWDVEYVGQCYVTLGWRRQYAGILKLKGRTNGVQVYFVDNEYYFGGRDAAIYGHGDDAERYAYSSRACLDIMGIMGWIPDVIHCNDWQTALTPVYLKSIYRHQFPNGEDFYASLKTALNLYHHDRNSFRAIQMRDMEQNFSWTRPAERYMELFAKMANNNR